MKLRAPAYPLITVDPYFSVWCDRDTLNENETVHWTGSHNTINGYVTVDGEKFRFMGDNRDFAKIEQTSVDFTALTTDYTFENEKIKLFVTFFTPLFTDDLYRLSRPVSYMNVKYENNDGNYHEVKIEVNASEELCLNESRDDKVVIEKKRTPAGYKSVSIGSASQKMLTRSGDNLRIEWGYFILTGPKNTHTFSFKDEDKLNFIAIEFTVRAGKNSTVLFAYDDIYSLQYFGRPVKAFWHTKGLSIEEAVDEAYAENDEILKKCRRVSDCLYADAVKSGGEKYAELLCLAYRQVIAAHKLAVTDNGENIFISKECFSNGCAATVDVSYPSSPFFALYNTELLKAMLRPVFDFAQGDVWDFDFAPHDVGQYPLVNGQVYGNARKTREDYLKAQMPVEECGNMIIMMTNIAIKDGNTDFADKYMPVLSQWVKYLIKFGVDPENQLCTDDFAGHFAHNCNLTLKAIMGVAGYSKILAMKGDNKADEYMNTAREMAESWMQRAVNPDGSFRLAFDREGSWSMKYNIIWDKIWELGFFPPYMYFSEFASNCKHINYYGMPLDNRKAYTKSDWLVWTACLAPTKEEFEKFIEPLWNAYNVSCSRVPMTDWYDTNTAQVVGFRNRTVQGGLFIRLMMK